MSKTKKEELVKQHKHIRHRTTSRRYVLLDRYARK